MICFYDGSSNNVSRNAQFVFVMSSDSIRSISVDKRNFRRFVANFTAKSNKIVPSNYWLHHDDSYFEPSP